MGKAKYREARKELPREQVLAIENDKLKRENTKLTNAMRAMEGRMDEHINEKILCAAAVQAQARQADYWKGMFQDASD